MTTSVEQRKVPESVSVNPIGPTKGACSWARLSPLGLGFGLGSTWVVFYLGCMLTMATVPRDKAVFFFNSLLHGLNVEPILKTSIPGSEVLMGLTTTFIMGWFAGVLIAGFYNLVICSSRSRD